MNLKMQYCYYIFKFNFYFAANLTIYSKIMIINHLFYVIILNLILSYSRCPK